MVHKESEADLDIRKGCLGYRLDADNVVINLGVKSSEEKPEVTRWFSVDHKRCALHQ